MDNKDRSGTARAKGNSSRKRGAKPQKKQALDTALLEQVRDLVGRVSDRLLSHLPGRVLLQFPDSEEAIVVQGQEKGLELEVVKEPVEADCSIVMAESDFSRVIDGSLNPQVAMLSDKIHVEGKMALAVYFFNVFAPHESSR